ncbi:MAG: hypothetical protein EAZ77_02050 [Nostocales cyanobacterium]|nr:MAG: hypothetical protein EAZ77_02050 [Nostocales cyanobacterium]
MAIKVTNSSSFTDIEVCINKWGDTGDTSYSIITKGTTETWDRTDERGFVMGIKQQSNEKQYYVMKGYDYVIEDEGGSFKVKNETTHREVKPVEHY